MSIFFTSDSHFGHQNIIKYCNRPFSDVEEMDANIVKGWNNVVGRKDTVYHLGDVAFHNYERISELNGLIRLVPGNHDHERAKKVMHLVHEVLQEVHYLKISSSQRFVLCHYPFESWRREYTFHLHGHTHGTAGVKMNRLDVGMDAMKVFAPLSLDEIMERMATNNLWSAEMNK